MAVKIINWMEMFQTQEKYINFNNIVFMQRVCFWTHFQKPESNNINGKHIDFTFFLLSLVIFLGVL